MNGPPTINQSTSAVEQLAGKFHVVSVDKLSTAPATSHDETTIANPQSSVTAATAADDTGCGSRFQMIRVDRNFNRGRWKVNDYEPPENVTTTGNLMANNIDNESLNISNAPTLSMVQTATTTTAVNTVPTNVPSVLSTDSNPTSSATLTATAASAAAAAATAFQQQQQRMGLGNAGGVVPTPNVGPSTGLLHGYPPATLTNITAQNPSFILQNHPQFGYYQPYFPHPYSPYAAQWAALHAPGPFLAPPMATPQLAPGNLGDPIRHLESDSTGENPVIASNQFQNPAADHLQNASIAAAPFLYAASHTHPTFVPPGATNTASPYATITSYHPNPNHPTIIPPNAQPLSINQAILNSSTESQQHSAQPVPSTQQGAPNLASPKHETSSAKQHVQQSNVPKTVVMTAPTNSGKPTTTIAPTNTAQITDLLSSSPSMSNPQQPPPTLLSPITAPNNPNNISSPGRGPPTSLNEIWPYTSNSPLNLSQTAAHTAAQTAAATAVAAMDLLNNESGKNAEIANVIFKELTTPTKQNNTTDIDNKISAAMDLVKGHLLSAVREEVTELRQQVRILNEKVNNLEHENAFLRQHVSSEILAQYSSLFAGLSTINDPSGSLVTTTTTTASNIPLSTSQPIPTASLSSLPTTLVQQSNLSSNPQATAAPLSAQTNLPST